MVKLFNRLMQSIIPLIPRSIVKLFAGRYVAGETTISALKTVRLLNKRGFAATLDILGEHVKSFEKAAEITHAYAALFDEIHYQKLDCNISIKPTHIGIELGDSQFKKNIDILVNKARETQNFLRIDMENSPFTGRTIETYKFCLQTYNGVGTVFQAYLHRTESDIRALFSPQFNFRLCKGIYHEDPAIAIQNRRDINKNYVKLLKIAFQNECYVGIATHDQDLLEDIYRIIDEMQVPSDRFEFQVLFGVPMSGWLGKHISRGYKVRIYVPFGPEWYDYSIRRLKENPNIVGYVMGNLLHKQ